MDPIERLREHASTHSDSKDLLCAAADEIERLRGGSEDDLEPPADDDPEAWSRYVGSLFARIETRAGLPPGSLTSLSM